jgi:hypothetical protein
VWQEAGRPFSTAHTACSRDRTACSVQLMSTVCAATRIQLNGLTQQVPPRFAIALLERSRTGGYEKASTPAPRHFWMGRHPKWSAAVAVVDVQERLSRVVRRSLPLESVRRCMRLVDPPSLPVGRVDSRGSGSRRDAPE